MNKYYTDDFCRQDNLSFEEEKELSQKIQAGEKAKQLLSGQTVLPKAERCSLELMVREGNLAYQNLVSANIPRARKFAYETWIKNRSGLNDLKDYEQTAISVVCNCARTYDGNKGVRFGTFAHNCLKNEMLRENARTCYALRIPEDNLLHLSAVRQGLEKTADGGCSAGFGLKDRAAAKLIAACRQSLSLQAPLTADGDDTELGEMLSDPEALTAEDIEEQIDKKDSLSRLQKALEALPENERILLKGRNGYYGKNMKLKDFIGTAAKSLSGVQKKEAAAVAHLKKLYFDLPLAG